MREELGREEKIRSKEADERMPFGCERAIKSDKYVERGQFSVF